MIKVVTDAELAADSELIADIFQNTEIRWYRFKMGAPSADEYSGVYW
jgi:hypothetical protein